MTFKKFNLHESLQLGLQDIGFNQPTPIQEKSIALILEGKDVLGSAQTGTGKTGAFVIPILHNMLRNPGEGTNVLILSPTRELAQQIDEQIFALGYHTGLHSATIIGGEDFSKQATAIRAGVDVIVATPGRLIDQMNVLDIDFSHIQCLILDEADRMLDMGFLPNVSHIISKLPKKRQTLLFSATMPREVEKLAKDIMKEPKYVKIESSKPAASIEQQAYLIDGREKLKLIQLLLDTIDWTSCIIFTATKRGTEQLERLLVKKGINVGSIHGDREQEERNKALNAFKNGTVPIIIATDVLARGIDIADVSLIINYDVPKAVEDYIHRIGRTGRYDKTGLAITLVNKKDTNLFKAIESKVGKELEIIDGDALLKDPDPVNTVTKRKSTTEKVKPTPPVTTEEGKPTFTPDWSKAKTIKVSKKENGTFRFQTIKRSGKRKKHPSNKISQTPSNKKQVGSPKRKADQKQHKGKQHRTAKPNINIKTLKKASDRNKNSHKPAKGMWGVIKSLFPKF